MVFRRNYKRSYRRRRFNRNKLARKKMVLYSKRIPKVLGYPRQKVYYFKRHFNMAPILAPADGVDVLGAYGFAISDLPNYTDFTNLFDFYKINKVVVRFMPVANLSDTTTFSNFSTMSTLRIFTAVDYNSVAQPADVNAVREYQNCKVTQYTSGQTRTFCPRANVEASSDVASNLPSAQYSQLGNPWINVAYEDVLHCGLKVAIDTSLFNTANITPDNVVMRVEGIMYFSCKNPR